MFWPCAARKTISILLKYNLLVTVFYCYVCIVHLFPSFATFLQLRIYMASVSRSVVFLTQCDTSSFFILLTCVWKVSNTSIEKCTAWDISHVWMHQWQFLSFNQSTELLISSLIHYLTICFLLSCPFYVPFLTFFGLIKHFHALPSSIS